MGIQKVIKRFKSKLTNPMDCFIIFSLFFAIVELLFLYSSHGSLFSKFFFWDTRDTGMDFFHSIEFLHGNSPYINFRTIYPPFANMLFKIIYGFIHHDVTENWPYEYVNGTYMRASEIDLRTFQSTMICFIAFIIIAVLFILLSVEEYFDDFTSKKKYLLSISVLVSYGCQYAFERGNIIILSIPLLIFYICYNQSKNPIFKELSIICLAFSFGLKIYPALYGIMLLKNGDYKYSFKAIIYGTLILLLPVFVFNGKPFDNLWQWTYDVLGFSSGSSLFARVLISKLNICATPESVNDYISICKYITIVLLLVFTVFEKKQFKVLLYLSSIVYLLGYETFYTLAYYVIPLFRFIKEEKEITSKNCLFYFVIVFMLLPLPIFGYFTRLLFNIFIIAIIVVLGIVDLFVKTSIKQS